MEHQKLKHIISRERHALWKTEIGEVTRQTLRPKLLPFMVEDGQEMLSKNLKKFHLLVRSGPFTLQKNLLKG